MNVRYEKFDVGLYVNLITKNMTSINEYCLRIECSEKVLILLVFEWFFWIVILIVCEVKFCGLSAIFG